MRLASLVIVLVATCATDASAAPNADYQVIQNVAITGGSVQILEDARLTPGLARRLWQTSIDPVFVLGGDDPAARAFRVRPLLPAKLRQITSVGKIFFEVILNPEAPLARVETRRLGAAFDPIYLVTTDDDAGWGSYSGRATSLYDVRDGRLTQLSARTVNGVNEPVVLVNSLKSGWKIRDANPAHIVIEQLFCRPDMKGAGFSLTYITYWCDGHAWRVARRSASGFWESDEGWPSATKFPRAGT